MWYTNGSEIVEREATVSDLQFDPSKCLAISQYIKPDVNWTFDPYDTVRVTNGQAYLNGGSLCQLPATFSVQDRDGHTVRTCDVHLPLLIRTVSDPVDWSTRMHSVVELPEDN